MVFIFNELSCHSPLYEIIIIAREAALEVALVDQWRRRHPNFNAAARYIMQSFLRPNVETKLSKIETEVKHNDDLIAAGE